MCVVCRVVCRVSCAVCRVSWVSHHRTQTRHSLGLFQYSTYDQGDYTNYIGTYGYLQPPPEWFAKVRPAPMDPLPTCQLTMLRVCACVRACVCVRARARVRACVRACMCVVSMWCRTLVSLEWSLQGHCMGSGFPGWRRCGLSRPQPAGTSFCGSAWPTVRFTPRRSEL
jgi:hypothetical protein